MNSVVESAGDIKLTDRVLFELDTVSDDYKLYITKLQQLEAKKLKLYLNYLKEREIVDNQETEYEDEFIIGLELMTKRKTSIDMVMEMYSKGIIGVDDIKRLHKQVIKGSADDLPKNYDYRGDTDIWVGTFLENGERAVDYYPPEYTDVKNVLQDILDYLNTTCSNINISDIFIKPFITHALIAYLQPFGNGNTRLARVLQHGKMCESTNEVFATEFNKPTFYLSKNYFQTRHRYRELIKRVAVNQNNEAWNEWLLYNIFMSQEQLYYLGSRVDYYRK